MLKKPARYSTKPKSVSGRFDRTARIMCVKIRRKRFSLRSASVSCWVSSTNTKPALSYRETHSRTRHCHHTQVPLRHSRDSFRGYSGSRWRVSLILIIALHYRVSLFAKYFLHVSDFPFHFAGDLFRRATVL